MAEQCPFTYKLLEEAVEKLKSCCAEKPFNFLLPTPNGMQVITANNAEEAYIKVKEMWEKSIISLNKLD